MKEPKVIEIFADNGEHSHWQLIDENGERLWSEEPTEVKNNAVLPLVSGSAFIAKADRENILVLVDDKYKVFNKLREIGKTWKSITIEQIDKVV